MMLGGMDVGLNTQNLVAILVVILLLDHQYFWCEDGRCHPEHFHRRESFGAAWPGALRNSFGRNAQAMAANFGANFWHNAGLGARTRSGRSRRAGGAGLDA